MTNKERLMQAIQISDFNVHEAALYLDTHKNDAEALRYFHKHQQMGKTLKEEYVRQYGPITRDEVSEKSFNWVKGPWPWENPDQMCDEKE